MLRIGITQRVEEIPERGERRDCLDQEWIRLLEAVEISGVPIPNQVHDVAGFVAALGLNGVILSGGNDLTGLPDARAPAPERDACEHAILQLSAESGLPVLGVCRGLQIMADHYGAVLTPLEGHVATRHAIRARGTGPLLLQDRDCVNSFHRWGLRSEDLTEDLRVAATGPDGTVEALYHARHRQAAVMWHPERDPSDPRDATLIQAFFKNAR